MQPNNNLQSFKQRSINALKWNYVGSIVRYGFQFLIGIVLARLLGPEPFGLVTVALTVVGVGAIFANFGLSSALVQRKEITTEDARYVFTCQTIIGAILTIVVYMSANAIGIFFHNIDSIPVVKAMSFIFVIQAAGQTSLALLQREMDFKRQQLAQLGSYFFGYVLFGLPLAMNGFGVWSLVIALLAQTSVNSIAVFIMVRHSVAPIFRRKDSGLFNFGLKLTATNLGSWGFTSIDNIAIGRVFGVVDLGLYNRASTLASTPVNIIVSSLQPVLFSVSARKQEDVGLLRETYLGVMGVMGFICLPLFLSIAVVPITVIGGIYGDKWLSAASLLVPFALLQPVFALGALGGPIMTGMGKAGQEMWVQFIALLFLVLGIWWATHYSVEMVAWVALAAYVLRFVLVTQVTLRLIKGSWLSIASVLWGPILLSVLSASMTFGAATLAASVFQSVLAQLVMSIVVGGSVSVVGFIMLRQYFVATPVILLVNEIGKKLPTSLRFFTI